MTRIEAQRDALRARFAACEALAAELEAARADPLIGELRALLAMLRAYLQIEEPGAAH